MENDLNRTIKLKIVAGWIFVVVGALISWSNVLHGWLVLPLGAAAMVSLAGAPAIWFGLAILTARQHFSDLPAGQKINGVLIVVAGGAVALLGLFSGMIFRLILTYG
jgi:hypothetical protein